MGCVRLDVLATGDVAVSLYVSGGVTVSAAVDDVVLAEEHC
jgi:hypothetical protein